MFIRFHQLDYGFSLLKRYTTKINGIEAVILHYSIPVSIEYYIADDIGWSVYFEHDGYVYEIEFSYPVEMSEEANADFNHMLKSFKILD
jgi:hypothetical protein